MNNVIELPKRSRKDKLIKVLIDDTQLAVLNEEARRLHCSRGQLVRNLIANHLAADDAPKRSVVAR